MTQFKHRNQGVTLVELLVVMAVLGLLTAILLPAIQSAREGARRASCTSNLRQLGIGMISYASDKGAFPFISNGKRRFSPISMALPYLDQVNLYDSLNFQTLATAPENRTAAKSRVSLFLCPSDIGGRLPTAGSNYACCAGYGYQVFGSLNGVFAKASSSPVSMAAVTDGLSTTAVMSEWILGPLSSGSGLERLQNVFSTTSERSGPDEFDAFIDLCEKQDLANSPGQWLSKGSHWITGEMGSTIYNHNMPPNRNSCFNGNLALHGSWTAGSRHPSGVNALFADGRVKFVRDTTAVSVWRALGTRSGGESISSDL